MTMIERVAMALSEALGDDWDSPTMFIDDANATHETCREIYRDMARAAIEAMRDPDEAMMQAVDCGGEKREWLSGKMRINNWQSMIDAALGKKAVANDN